MHRHGADLIQKQGAVVGRLKLADLVPHRSGKSPAHMTEQLALQQGFRDGAAIDRHKGV